MSKKPQCRLQELKIKCNDSCISKDKQWLRDICLECELPDCVMKDEEQMELWEIANTTG